MSKKQDFIRSEQNRDKHPDSGHRGSAKAVEADARTQSNESTPPQDRQAAHSGKLANDHNKQGDQHPTQKNEARRTPESRHERQVISGGPMNIVEARTGGKGGGRGTRGGNVGGAG